MANAMHSEQHAQELDRLVSNFKKGIYEDVGLLPMCHTCKRTPAPGETMMRCSGCKVVKYCSDTCANKDWAGQDTPFGKGEPHKSACPVLKDCMASDAPMRAIAKQFPWAREQEDGTFSFTVFRASLGLCGTGLEYGWWTEEPCCNEQTKYFWGLELLLPEHLSEREGWKLPDDQIPWLDFSEPASSLPQFPATFAHTWTDYYKWRGLPLESPACLLLHWPLSVYRLLHLLHLTTPGTPETRRKLTVHYIGVEQELDFLPIYGELALLFPNTDLELVLFGRAIVNVQMTAVLKPSCLATQEYVYTYTAPATLGSGTIRISFAKSNGFWDGAGISSTNKPDALIACNAGIATYHEWKPVVLTSRAFAIPFAVTDYMETSLHSDIRLVHKQLPYLAHLLPWPAKATLGQDEMRRIEETPGAHFEIGLNPFMCLGPQPQRHARIPNALNGFEMVVTPGVLSMDE